MNDYLGYLAPLALLWIFGFAMLLVLRWWSRSTSLGHWPFGRSRQDEDDDDSLASPSGFGVRYGNYWD